MPSTALLRDPWLRACALSGLVMAAVQAISGLPWSLWFAWAYVALLSVLDRRVPSGDTVHSGPPDGVWQTPPDE